jgi:hypothetical protein
VRGVRAALVIVAAPEALLDVLHDGLGLDRLQVREGVLGDVGRDEVVVLPHVPGVGVDVSHLRQGKAR